jgi:hypothetical protein
MFFVLLCLSFNISKLIPVSAVNTFKEGIYKVADLNFSPNSTYSIQNVSPNDSVSILVFDETQIVRQSIRLDPKSSKYELLPLKPDYRIVIVGNAEVFIA